MWSPQTPEKQNHYDDGGIQQDTPRKRPRDLLRHQTAMELHTLPLSLLRA